MRYFALCPALLLAACGGGEPVNDITNDPVALNVIEATSQGKSAAVAAATDCGNLPDFIPVYAGAQVTTCVSGPDGRSPRHVSGSVVYLTDATPSQVLAWSRTHANASGLAHGASSEKTMAAGEQAKRSVTVLAEPFEGRTRVTVNWGSGVAGSGGV